MISKAITNHTGESTAIANVAMSRSELRLVTRATLDTVGKMVMGVTPTGRLGNDEDLKGLAVLLASEASRHITGQAIAVDGGATLI